MLFDINAIILLAALYSAMVAIVGFPGPLAKLNHELD